MLLNRARNDDGELCFILVVNFLVFLNSIHALEALIHLSFVLLKQVKRGSLVNGRYLRGEKFRGVENKGSSGFALTLKLHALIFIL